MDLVPEGHIPRVVEFSKSQGRSCEQSFSYWLLYTMFTEGEGQWALDYIRKYWGSQMKQDDFNGAWHEMWASTGEAHHIPGVQDLQLFCRRKYWEWNPF